MPKKPSDQVTCFKHAMKLLDVIDIPVNDVKVEITGKDPAYDHVWLKVEVGCLEKVRVVKESLNAELCKIMNGVKPVDSPIDRLFDGTAMYLRMAKSGERKGHFGVYNTRDSKSESYKEIWKQTKVDDALRNLIGGLEKCDIDVCVAGAFSFEEGTRAAVVCRRMYTNETKVVDPTDVAAQEGVIVVEHEDAADEL